MSDEVESGSIMCVTTVVVERKWSNITTVS